jgi:poly-gamma-glutamate system protein
MADHQPNPRNPETSGCRTHFLPPDKLRLRLLLAALLALLLSIALLRASGYAAEKDNAAVMKKASENLRDCFQAVKDERLRLGHPIDYDADVNGTGMLGDEYTAITTSHGNLEAKRSAANPNTAAMMVDLLARCGVKAGDTVACNFSSSFPTLNLATVCALDALGARGVIINSIGASTYGANLPDLTYPDMEHLLLENHQIKNHAEYFSAGGAGDQGREMPEEVKSAIVSRIEAYGLSYINISDLEENLDYRKNIYNNSSGPVACFVNVGGNLLAFGGGDEMTGVGSGIVSAGDHLPGEGLIPYYYNQGIPVIHLLNMKALLPENGLPFDPIPLPEPGEGEVYRETRYPKPLAAGVLAANLALWILLARHFPRRRIPI